MANDPKPANPASARRILVSAFVFSDFVLRITLIPVFPFHAANKPCNPGGSFTELRIFRDAGSLIRLGKYFVPFPGGMRLQRSFRLFLRLHR